MALRPDPGLGEADCGPDRATVIGMNLPSNPSFLSHGAGGVVRTARPSN
jgi:hypothetical protein